MEPLDTSANLTDFKRSCSSGGQLFPQDTATPLALASNSFSRMVPISQEPTSSPSAWASQTQRGQVVRFAHMPDNVGNSASHGDYPSHDGNGHYNVNNLAVTRYNGADDPEEASLFIPTDDDSNPPGNFEQQYNNSMPNLIQGSSHANLKQKHTRNTSGKGAEKSSRCRRNLNIDTGPRFPTHPLPVEASRSSSKPLRGAINRAKRVRPENDPENHLIKELRTKYMLPWPEIVVIMNAKRREQGKADTFTDAAVYGRFTRNAPRIARVEGDFSFDKNDWMYLKHGGGGRASRRQNTATCASSATPETSSDESPPSPVSPFNSQDAGVVDEVLSQLMQQLFEVAARQVNERTGGGVSPRDCAEHFYSNLQPF